jgi:hypothetical protein
MAITIISMHYIGVSSSLALTDHPDLLGVTENNVFH